MNSGIGEGTPRSFSARVLGMVWAGFAMIIGMYNRFLTMPMEPAAAAIYMFDFQISFALQSHRTLPTWLRSSCWSDRKPSSAE